MREVADRFVEGVAREAERLRLGDPLRVGDRDRPDDLRGPVRDRRRADRGRGRLRRDQALRRPDRGRRAAGQVHRPDRPHRGHPRDADHARGDLRPGAADRRRRLRAGGDRPRQRLRVRPRRLGLDQGPPEGRADRAADRVGDGLGQRPLLQPRRLPVRLGRRQGLRRRPLALEIRLLRVRQHQDERLGAGADPRLLVAPLRPHARRSGARLGASCSTARAPTRTKALREGAGPLLKVGRRTLRKKRG